MDNARFWKSLIGTISALLDEGNFNVDADGIRLRSMDPSHVAMVDFALSKDAVEEYSCSTPIKLCINIAEMLKLLRRVGGNESIELTYDPEKAKLDIVLKSNYTRTFSIATLEPTTDEVPAPKIAFNAQARITTDCLKNAIDDAATVSDHIQFEMVEGKLVMRSSGDLGSAVIEVEEASEELLKMAFSEPSQATFSLSYLSDMVKAASSLSDIVTLEFSTNMPIRLNFELPQKGQLQYYLAPRIETA